LRLAVEQKKVFKKYGLTPETFKTMCHRCGCCDIVPFIDL
ncbi:MAG: biotin synthase, partial [Thermoplasmata archaeon]